jgi:pSer/pThr/pTyr-binding forkhead associated (FHA) protein
MARLVVQTGGLDAAPSELKWGVTRVGRAPDSDILINHPSVSGRHCEIELGPDYVIVRDCGSTNGTFIDGKPVSESKLESGQRLKLGQVEAIVERFSNPIHVPSIEVEKLPETVPLADGTLSCVNHPDLRAYWRCNDCQKLYCTGCIHELHMQGGRAHRLCPKCSHAVELIVWDDRAPKKKSIWGKIKGAFSKARRERTVRIR